MRELVPSLFLIRVVESVLVLSVFPLRGLSGGAVRGDDFVRAHPRWGPMISLVHLHGEYWGDPLYSHSDGQHKYIDDKGNITLR